MAREDRFRTSEEAPANDGRPLGAPEPVPPEVVGPTLRDPLAEALRLIGLADKDALHVRLMGAGIPRPGARLDRSSRTRTARHRPRDAEQRPQGAVGPDGSFWVRRYRQYNALYGHKQMYFMDPARGRPVDVIVDRLDMCHTFEFADRLGVDRPTLPLAEMLLSKLQIAHINRKDILDLLALLSNYPLGPRDEGTINLTRITALTSTDWGWWRTLTGNLDKLRLFVATEWTGGARVQPTTAIQCRSAGRRASNRHRRRFKDEALEVARAGRRAAGSGSRSQRRSATAGDCRNGGRRAKSS